MRFLGDDSAWCLASPAFWLLHNQCDCGAAFYQRMQFKNNKTHFFFFFFAMLEANTLLHYFSQEVSVSTIY